MKTNKQTLLKNQSKLLGDLKNIEPFIAGSLTTIKRICGTKTCSCHTKGIKHSAMYLTWKGENQKNEIMYIPVAMQDEVKSWSENYKKIKTLIKKISDNQKNILKLR